MGERRVSWRMVVGVEFLGGTGLTPKSHEILPAKLENPMAGRSYQASSFAVLRDKTRFLREDEEEEEEEEEEEGEEKKRLCAIPLRAIFLLRENFN
ncbi:hypothetical protein HZH68_012890 [Vespula germanica]|uniref:Uncharacterized protein n=1 Tax=Vespula germanica TaxID=30212 RepID=A0A834MY09_VESGE|nr:hypothetical protein HZH68_012890 [Vespula germanica]